MNEIQMMKILFRDNFVVKQVLAIKWVGLTQMYYELVCSTFTIHTQFSTVCLLLNFTFHSV